MWEGIEGNTVRCRCVPSGERAYTPMLVLCSMATARHVWWKYVEAAPICNFYSPSKHQSLTLYFVYHFCFVSADYNGKSSRKFGTRR